MSDATGSHRQRRSGLELSIIMPCLNEAETLATCIRKAQRFLAESRIPGEVVVGDNGSTDGSQAIGQALGARVVSVPLKGYGSALMGAIAAAQGQYIIMGDADDSYDFSCLAPFIDRLREGYDLVVGNRFAGGIAPGAMPLLHRYCGNPLLTAVGRVFFHSPCRDFNCGLRGFRKAAIEDLDLRTTGMEFASEMVVKAALFDLRVAEAPTTLSRDGRSHPPHLRRWRDGWRHMTFLLLYCPRWLFFLPGSCLMSAGIILMIWLLPGPRRIGGLGLDIHTLVYAAMAILIGFQAIVFAAFTKVFAISEGLLPRDKRFDKMFQYINLEVGLTIGAVMIAMGWAGTVAAVLKWQRQGFGALSPSQTMRMILPAVTALTVGCQTVLSSFFLSVLGLRRR
jgi:glycosyltransferase involved in cell wall biosynthesis